jgi:mRNA-degrading endonuclease RelE of RelBE toxin-antitoxin system
MGNKNYAVHITKSVEDDLKEFDSYRTKVIQEILVLESNPLAGHALKVLLFFTFVYPSYYNKEYHAVQATY